MQVRSSGQYCPVSIAADVLGDRWTLLILREMIGGSTRFNEIERCLPRISRSLLSQRLRQLARLGIVEAVPLPSGRGHEYHLTEAGRALDPVLEAMGDWALHHLFEDPTPEQLDPTFVMWWMQRRVHHDALPEGRTVVQFDIVDGREHQLFWLVLQPDEVSVCKADPGFEVDVWVRADSMAFHKVFAGRITLAEALDAGTVTIEGPRGLVRELPTWFAWSPFYDRTRELIEQGVITTGG